MSIIEETRMTMDQMKIDDFLDFEPELICCSLSQGYHWLKITSGHTPSNFTQYIDFEHEGFENLYQGTSVKDALISAFGGTVRVIPFSITESLTD